MERKGSWIKSYTIIFALSSLLFYSLNILHGKSFVFSGVSLAGDGLVQHYTALAYYGEYLRTIVKNLFVLRTFSIPEFDLSIGLGGSIVTTLGYEVLGDPLNLLAVFIPMQYTEYLYILLVIIRLYLAGIAFCQYCFYHSYAAWQVFPGMMVYVFSFYTVAVSVLHPFFLNPLIYLPLILLGVDKIFRESRHMPFILSCVLAAASNFYFFYMLTIMAFLYSVPYFARIFLKEVKWRQGLWKFGELLSCYLVSLMLAAPIFLPMATAVLSSGRVGGSKPIPLLYEPVYYVKLPIAFMNASADHYAHLGYGAVAVLAVWMLFIKTNRREKLSLKAAFTLGTIFLLFPFFGSALNGFGYATNRWVWAYGFVVAVIVVSQFPVIVKLGKGAAWTVTGATLLCMVPTFFVRAGGEKGKLLAAVVLLAVGAFLCAVMFLGQRHKNGMVVVYMAIISANIFLSMFSLYSPLSGDYLKDCGSWGHAWQDMTDGPLGVLEGLDRGERENVRVDTSNLSMAGVRANSAMLWDINSISFYFSMIDGSSAAFLHEMQLPTPFEHQYVDLDGRAILSSLLGVRYQIVRQGGEEGLPYGYNRFVQERNGYALYETDYALPLVFLYDRVIGEADYQALDVAEKQQTMMQAAVVSEEDIERVRVLPTVRPEDLEYSHWDSAYNISGMQGVSIHDNQYVVTEAGAYIQLETDCSYGTERYFIFKNLWYEGADSAQVTVLDGVKQHELTVNSVSSNYYAGIHDFLCNMGYSENHGGNYRIIFSVPGTYSMDEIRICNQPLERLKAWSYAGKEREAEFSIGEDELTLRAEAGNDSLLYLSIPYSVGWKAWVDGEKATILKTNHFGMGIYLTPGEHSIRLEYHTPYLRSGLLLMAAGVLGCCAVSARRKKRGGKHG